MKTQVEPGWQPQIFSGEDNLQRLVIEQGILDGQWDGTVGLIQKRCDGR